MAERYTSKMLRVSSQHITLNDNCLLNNGCQLNVEDMEESWLIVAESAFDDAVEDGFSKAFCDLIKLAEKEGCDMLYISANIDPYEDLPKFDW